MIESSLLCWAPTKDSQDVSSEGNQEPVWLTQILHSSSGQPVWLGASSQTRLGWPFHCPKILRSHSQLEEDLPSSGQHWELCWETPRRVWVWWANFAKGGYPTLPSAVGLPEVKATVAQQAVLHIGKQAGTLSLPWFPWGDGSIPQNSSPGWAVSTQGGMVQSWSWSKVWALNKRKKA